jgi:hypothetical protein
MADYFVFWNKLMRRARIHRSTCGACNNGEARGKVGLKCTHEWIPADSYIEARSIANAHGRRKGFKLNCVLCQPQKKVAQPSPHQT